MNLHRPGCVHIESYTNFEDGVNVGHASDSDEANHVSALLAKVRAAISAFKPVNTDGPVPVHRVKELLKEAEMNCKKDLTCSTPIEIRGRTRRSRRTNPPPSTP